MKTTLQLQSNYSAIGIINYGFHFWCGYGIVSFDISCVLIRCFYRIIQAMRQGERLYQVKASSLLITMAIRAPFESIFGSGAASPVDGCAPVS